MSVTVNYTEYRVGEKTPYSNKRVSVCPSCGENAIVTTYKDGSSEAIHSAEVNQFDFEGKTYNARAAVNSRCRINWPASKMPAPQVNVPAAVAADPQTVAWENLLDSWMTVLK